MFEPMCENSGTPLKKPLDLNVVANFRFRHSLSVGNDSATGRKTLPAGSSAVAVPTGAIPVGYRKPYCTKKAPPI
jgi:hypothetical protein